MRKLGAAILLSLSFCSSVFPQELRVENEHSPVYSEPRADAEVLGYLPKGKRAQSVDEEGAFFRVRSRSGRHLWIGKTSVGPVLSSDPYDVSSDVLAQHPNGEPDFRRIRLDMGASGGRTGNESFLEGALGVEYYMMERLSLRNALFYRRSQVREDSFGLDVSVRGNGKLLLGALGLRGILGTGYRLTTEGSGALFYEVGGFAALAGFDIGLMLKYLHNSLGDSSRENVVVYSVVFSGTTGFF